MYKQQAKVGIIIPTNKHIEDMKINANALPEMSPITPACQILNPFEAAMPTAPKRAANPTQSAPHDAAAHSKRKLF